MNLKEDMHSTLVRRLSRWIDNPNVLDKAVDILERWYGAEFMSDEEIRQMDNSEFYNDVLDLAFAASDTQEANIIRKALGYEPYTEKADKNTDAGAYKTKSNHYEAPEKKKSKKLGLSIGDVVALNPNSAWSPDPKKAAGLYAVVTAIKVDDTVSVEAENGTVYRLFDINQFAKIKEGLEPHTGPKWDADIKQRATFYVGQDKYDAHEILQLMAKEYQTTPEEISRITGLKESFHDDQIKAKVKAQAKANNRAALGNLAKGMVNKSPAAKAVANRMGVKTEKEDADYDEDYYYSEGNKVRLNPNVSESFEGDIATIKGVAGNHIMVEVAEGIIPVLRSDIKEAFEDDDWQAQVDAEMANDDPEEIASFEAMDKEHGLDFENADDEIVDNIVDAVARRTGISFEDVLDNYPYDEILDRFETFGQDTDATVDSLVDQIENYGEEETSNAYDVDSSEPLFPEDEDEFDPRGREDMPPPGYGA